MNIHLCLLIMNIQFIKGYDKTLCFIFLKLLLYNVRFITKINFIKILYVNKMYLCLHLERVISELNHSGLGLGLDTFEEKEEKEQFFAKLEKGLTSSIDYSRLNKELDSNDSTQFKALHR